MRRLPHIPWPYADHPQFAESEVKTFRGREWVSLELAEGKLQWWQARDWDSGRRIIDLEDELADLRKPPIWQRLRTAFTEARGDA